MGAVPARDRKLTRLLDLLTKLIQLVALESDLPDHVSSVLLSWKLVKLHG